METTAVISQRSPVPTIPHTNSSHSSEGWVPLPRLPISKPEHRRGHFPAPAISLDFRASNAAIWPFSRFSSRLMRASSVFACRSLT